MHVLHVFYFEIQYKWTVGNSSSFCEPFKAFRYEEQNIQMEHLCLLKGSEFTLWLVVSLKKYERW